ncbi:hypothetical protein Tco_0919428, partial [Tanacetum coccineum]
LPNTVQREAEKQKRLNNELKKQKDLIQQELETFKDRVKTFESQTVQCSKYKETCDDLKRELRNDKNMIDQLLKEKDKIQSDCFKIENEKVIIQHETQLAKKAFKERENQHLKDIVELKEKLSSDDRIVYKMVQPKMYDGDMLHSEKLIINSPDSEETVEDAEESEMQESNKKQGKKDLKYDIYNKRPHSSYSDITSSTSNWRGDKGFQPLKNSTWSPREITLYLLFVFNGSKYKSNIMDEVDIEDLIIEQYLRLAQENQTPKKIEDMTIAEYVEYEKIINNTK